jgi:hypothetical protein
MPRTYRFDHFTVPKHDVPAQPESAKARVAGTKSVRGDTRPRYGRRFAETEEMAHVRQMNAQFEELAGVAAPKLSTSREPERPEPRARPRSVVSAVPGSMGAPIGAFPVSAAARAAVPEAPPEPEGLRDLFGAGARQIHLIRHCVVDGVSAGFRLAMLPLQAARLTARKLLLYRLHPRPA